MSNMQIECIPGKKYKRRNGKIATVIGYGTISEKPFGRTTQFDTGSNVWQQNGKVIYYSEDMMDIIEEVKENEMKIEVGKWYKTREGYKAFVSHKIIDGVVATCPYGGYIIDQFNTAALWCWHENGTASRDGEIDEYDLIEEWKEPKSGVAYANIYTNEYTQNTYHLSAIAAQKYAVEKGRDRLACVRIEWKEGQFDD